MTKEKKQERVLIKDLKDHIGEDVMVAGWVSTIRDHGKVAFIVPQDRSGTVQAVASGDYNDTALPESQKLSEQWVVEIVGEVKERPEKMRKDELNGELELGIKEVKVLSRAAELPFAMDAEFNLDTYLDHLPLTLRAKRHRDVFKVQSTILSAFHQSMQDRDFTQFAAPALVPGDAEGGGEAFSVEYFNDKTAYLATSPQLYKEIMVGVFERAYTVAKIFRAERSMTTRHLNELTQMDFEMGFIKDHTDVMAVLEESTKQIVATVAEKHADIFESMDVPVPAIPEKFPVFTLREAQEIIEKEFGGKAVGELDMEPEHERQICEYALKEFGCDFVFITHFPTKKRAFYTYSNPENTEETLSFDLLFRGLEINSGGQRIHDYDEMIKKMETVGINPENFELYLEAFKYGMPPHGGCSTGLERMTMRMLNLKNVRQAVPFPRDMNRIDTLLSKEPEKKRGEE